jgi:hypothetical protein
MHRGVSATGKRFETAGSSTDTGAPVKIGCCFHAGSGERTRPDFAGAAEALAAKFKRGMVSFAAMTKSRNRAVNKS